MEILSTQGHEMFDSNQTKYPLYTVSYMQRDNSFSMTFQTA